MSININQTLMAVVGIGAIIVLIWRHRPGSAEPNQAEMMANEPAPSDALLHEVVTGEEYKEMPTTATPPRSRAKRPVKRKSTAKSPAKTPSKRNTAAKKSG